VDVGRWLKSFGLGQYEAAFRENDVSAELLPNLTADDLKELGVTSGVDHRDWLRPDGVIQALNRIGAKRIAGHFIALIFRIARPGNEDPTRELHPVPGPANNLPF
jgi:SAM domain (Sterile alpha motif)